jgi:hypothetical protein
MYRKTYYYSGCPTHNFVVLPGESYLPAIAACPQGLAMRGRRALRRWQAGDPKELGQLY